MDTNAMIGLGLGLAMAAVLVVVLVWHIKGSRAVMAAVELERQKSWHATVTRRENQAFHVNATGPSGAPSGGMAHTLVVYFRCDDGMERHVMAYEGDVMRSCYTGALAYYREAPGHAVLDTWQVGDHLYKPAGEHFPHKVED